MFVFNPTSHGVHADSIESNVTRSALSSLRLALKSYFSTYTVLHKRGLVGVVHQGGTEWTDDYIDQVCSDIDYQEAYMQTIFHFHHFFELFLKDILASINQTLSLKMDFNDANIILKLLKGQTDDILGRNTIEFSSALDRLLSLIDSDTAPIVTGIIKKYSETLKTLNQLRNRAWHRGTYMLRITELDQFVGKNLFPLLKEVLRRSHYINLERYWKYKSNKFDPIEKIISAASGDPINYKEIAFYKAYGQACYTQPIGLLQIHKNETEAMADAIEKALHEINVETCFICGAETLMVNSESDFDLDEAGNYLAGWWNTTSAECLNCGLSIYPDAGDPIKYGITTQPLWTSGKYEES